MSLLIVTSLIIIILFVAISLFLKNKQTHILYSTDNCILYSKQWPSRMSIIWKREGIKLRTSFLESTYLGVVASDIRKETNYSSLLSNEEHAHHNQALRKLFEEFIFAVSHRGENAWGDFFTVKMKNRHVENYIINYNKLAANNNED